MSQIRLVLSCGMERIVDSLVLDAYDIKEGDIGWCDEHEGTDVLDSPEVSG